jgi:Tfp pilus assembly protein PilO
MNNRTIAGGALVGVLVLAVWWMFVFSPVRSDASKVDGEIDSAQAETRNLETEVKQLEDLEARAPEIQADLERLRAAVPATPELASFIDAANALGVETGVEWVSISPTPPQTTGASETVQMSIELNGGYFQVLDYLNRVETMSRLVVIDQISLSAAEQTESSSEAPTLTASLTARMFSQAASPASPATATTGSES